MWVLTAFGKDRPGIVAGVTKIMHALGCNLEDSAMKRLGGEFVIMLIFSSPARVREAALRKAFAPLQRRLRLAVHVKGLASSELSAPSAGRPHIISVYGADRPGIVHGVSELLAKRRINITDVQTHRSRAGKGGKSLYLMLLEVELPSRATASSLEPLLKRAGKRLGVEISLRPADANVL
jgi:glycine cleavage system transcriptional repressor